MDEMTGSAPEAPASNDSWNDSQSEEKEGRAPEPQGKGEASPGDSSSDNSDDKKEKGEPAPKRKPPKMIKIDDEEIDEEDLIRNYKKYKGADKKFREAADLSKKVQGFIKALEQDPEAILSNPKLPLDKRKLGEKWLRESIEQELEDPKDRKLKEYETKLEKYEREQREAKEAEEKAEKDKKRQTRQGELSETLAKAMEKSVLSKHQESSAATLREMATYLRVARERGDDPSPDEIAQHVENQRFKQMYLLANELEGEDLVGFLGDEVVNKIRKFDLSRLRAKKGETKTNKDTSWKPKQSKNEIIDPWTARQNVRKNLGL